MSDGISILIVDDHHIVRLGIKNMLNRAKGFRVVGEADNGNDAINKVEELLPDVVIMDIAMPLATGIEATVKIIEKWPKTKVLILTMYENEDYVIQVFNSGASGYILKNAKMPEFIKAIRTVAEGNTYYSMEISSLIVTGFNKEPDEPHPECSSDDLPALTEREKEIVKLIVEGLSNKMIAEKLFISVQTVETHRKNFMRKIKAHNTADIIKFAIHSGLVVY
ncbi:MAG: response regulator transcription factor [Bacteroidia bacterium]|nr:response regulator transcription factor [Bacteroidia bacterium]